MDGYRDFAKAPSTYDRRPESNEDVSVTPDKKGKRPERELSVEIEAALKAGHAVDFDRDMQF